MADEATKLSHTGAQIDEAVTKVLTTGEIAKLVRDEVKAQLSAITSGIVSVPVFDSTAVMKSMALADFAKVICSQSNGILSGSVLSAADGWWGVNTNVKSATDLPTSTFFGVVFIKTFTTSGTPKVYFAVGYGGVMYSGLSWGGSFSGWKQSTNA